MVAVLKIYYDYGGSDGSPGTAHNVTDNGSNKIRFKTDDDADIDSNNPIQIPTDGSIHYSFWKHIYAYCSTAPSTQIDNIKLYSDGSGFGTGITLYTATTTPTKNSGASSGYAVAIGTVGSSGKVMTEHGSVSAIADMFSYTSTSPLTVSISESGNIINSIGETSDYVVLQLAVSSTASGGTLTAESLSLQYDEI